MTELFSKYKCSTNTKQYKYVAGVGYGVFYALQIIKQQVWARNNLR